MDGCVVEHLPQDVWRGAIRGPQADTIQYRNRQYLPAPRVMKEARLAGRGFIMKAAQAAVVRGL
jgi:hypothetical protein